MSVIAPIRRQVIVNASPERAFESWTNEIAQWWPMAQHSVYGEGGTARFVDDQLVESGPNGASCVWGTVSEWLPGEWLSMTWHPGHDESEATQVDVRFDALPGDRTLVTLTHSGWERRADPLSMRANYRNGWPTVVGRFAASSSDPATSTHSPEHVWLLLHHSVDPEITGSVFESPLFAEHVAFLGRAQERGWLVAAGNLPDSPGSGMTVLRVPLSDLEAAVVAAQDDDLSVAKGLFDVHIRQWNVVRSTHP